MVCFSLVVNGSLRGYAVFRPIRRNQPLALNHLRGEISSNADRYFIHDLAIMPYLQGHGLAQECDNKSFTAAEKFETTGLVSIHGAAGF